MFPKGKYNTDISENAQYLALFRSRSDRKQIRIIGESMFDKNSINFMNAYYKETEKPFGYSFVDNKPDTPAEEQVLADLFGECYVYIARNEGHLNCAYSEFSKQTWRTRYSKIYG